MSAESPISKQDISSTFVKGMAVLRAFDDINTRLTLADIAKSAGLDRASARRLILTLVYLGYARKSGRHISLTPKILTLAGSFLRGNHFGTLVQPILNRQSAASGISISIALPDDGTGVYVAQSNSHDQSVSFGFTVGSRLPLLHTAIGRMILALSSPERRKDVLNNEVFSAYTPESTMDRDIIAEAIELCAVQGYAITNGEFERGIAGIAIPVGSRNDYHAVVGTSVPSDVVRDKTERMRIVTGLQEVARELGHTQVFADL